MPLVVPGLQSKDGAPSGDDWMSKLMGKKLGDQHDEIVSLQHRLVRVMAAADLV